jgi:hypothetical protein
MPDEKKVDPFKPQQPVIPGVPPESQKRATRAEKASSSDAPVAPSALPAPANKPLLWVGVAAGVVLVAAGIAWWAHGSSARSAPPVVTEAPPEPAPPPKPVAQLPFGPGQIARAEDLSKPWSSSKFIFRSPYTVEDVPAIAVRLPGGELWAISLREPYGTCDLEYVTDLEQLRTRYHYEAEHPMVVNTCSRAVFDLARYGNGPNGLVRGAIVKGTAVRPPIGIEVKKQGAWIEAVRIENNR